MGQNIVIKPNKDGVAEQPKIDFVGSDVSASEITLKVLGDSGLSFEGTSGQLFSINNNLSTGKIFSVNDISGIPSIDVDADGTVRLAPFNGTVYSNTLKSYGPISGSGAGNSLTIAAGSGVTSGAGGNLILQAGLQATTGGDGRVDVRMGTTAANMSVYNTYTDSSNFERLNIGWSGNVCSVISDFSGTGSQTRALVIGTKNSSVAGAAGGGVSLVAGAGSASGSTSVMGGSGGSVSIIAGMGNGNGGNGGSLGGSITIAAGGGGNGNGGSGGSVSITAGSNNGNNTTQAGILTLTAGDSFGGGAAGTITISGGRTSGGTTTPGNVSISGGGHYSVGNTVGVSGTGSVNISSPNSSTLTGIYGTTVSNTGSVTLTTGNGGTIASTTTAATTTNGNSGSISITTGTGGVAGGGTTTRNAGSSGAITITTSAGGTASGGTTSNGGSSGSVTISTGVAGVGETTTGTVGSIILATGGVTRATVNATGIEVTGSVVAAPVSSGLTASITAATGASGTITYTCANTFTAGRCVSVTGLGTSSGTTLNIAGMTIATASSTNFTVTNSTVGVSSGTGTATAGGNALALSSGTAVTAGPGGDFTISAGSGVGVGAGGNLILQAGVQGTSGGDGRVILRRRAGQTSNLLELQTSAGVNSGSIDQNGCLIVMNQNNAYSNPSGVALVPSLTGANNQIVSMFNGGNGGLDFYGGAFNGGTQIGTSNVAPLYMRMQQNGFIGIAASSALARLHVQGAYNGNPSNTKVLIVQGMTGQTNALQEWQGAAGTALSSVGPDGTLYNNSISSNLIPSIILGSITEANGNGTTITYTCPNTFTAGHVVSVTGLTTSSGTTLNIADMTIATASSVQFTVTNATVGVSSGTGTATVGLKVVVTAASGTGTTVTYTTLNTFSVGQVVSITGLTTTTGSSLNLSSQTIVTASTTAFTVTNTTVGTAVATQAGTAIIQSAGNNVVITAGSGSGVGAGGNLILQAGVQGTSGGDGVIKISSVVTQTGTTMKFQNTTTDATTASATPRISFITDRSGTAQEAYFWRGRLFVPNIGNIPTICFAPGGGSNESSGYLGEGIGNVIGTGGIGIFAAHNARLWCIQAMTGVTSGLGFGPVATTTDVAIGRAEVGVLRVSNGANQAGQLTTGGSLSFPSATTNVAASVNDLALPASAFQRINCTTASSITGIAPPSGGTHVDGRMMRVYNTGTAALTLTHNHATLSTPANRMFMSGGSNLVVAVNGRAEFIYDSTNNGSGAAGWRIS